VIIELIAALQREVTDKKKIALPLFHLYRSQSLLPEYLKGIDSQLYQHFAEHFSVHLQPVVVRSESNYEGGYDADGYDINPCDANGIAGVAADDCTVTYIATGDENTYCVESTEYIEYTGNEAQLGAAQYFLSVMVLGKKK
jgi:hypothetical protein